MEQGGTNGEEDAAHRHDLQKLPDTPSTNISKSAVTDEEGTIVAHDVL